MEDLTPADQSPHDARASAQPTERLRAEQADIGHLDRVLRGYYLGQIKQIENRRDRRRARILMENHLVLPKSRQRTSKDAAYIQEVTGIDSNLLTQLEESRLIRRLNQTGHNPIYEVSHDTLVEPILAERHNREAILSFVRTYGRWFLLLLLALFGFGMLFENWFDLLDDSLAFRGPTTQEVQLQANGDIFAGQGTHPEYLVVPFPNFKEYRGIDSLILCVGVNVTANAGLDGRAGQDTIALNLGAIPISVSKEGLKRLLETGRDTAIPMRIMVPLGTGASEPGLLADVAGMTLLRLQTEGQSRGAEALPLGANQRTRGMDVYQADFGRKTISAGAYTRTVTLDTVMNLADLLPNDQTARSLLAGRSVRLTYQVNVAPAPSPQKRIEYVPVSGIEVQYSDGTKRFIPGNPGLSTQPVTHTVRTGETLFKISKLYGLTPEQLRKLNNLRDNNLSVGQVLKVK